MCDRASFIAIRGGRIAWLLDSDSHDDVIKAEGLKDVSYPLRAFVRIECEPKADPFSTDPNDWTVKEDEDELPSWYDHEEWAGTILDELIYRRIPEEKRTGHCGKLNVKQSAEYTWLTTAQDVTVYENATLDAPMLTTAQDVRMREGATLSVPALTTAQGVIVWKDATLSVPALTTAQYVRVWVGATLDAPALTTAQYVRVHEGATLNAPMLKR